MARIGVLASLLVFGLAARAPGSGPYVLAWSTVDGGGGQSSGGQYVLTGTIGQPDAAYSEGGEYELLGGFWAGGPLCFVDFRDFARFAEYWLQEGNGMPKRLCPDSSHLISTS